MSWPTLTENPAGEAGARALRDAKDAAVDKRLAELEAQLGGKGLNDFQKWNTGQQKMSRLIEEKLRLMSEIQEWRAHLEALERDLKEGRTPPDIETVIRSTGSYTKLRSKVIEHDIGIQEVQTFMGPKAGQVVALQQARDFWQKKADQEHEDLKKTLCEGRKAEYESELKASEANLERIQTLIDESGKELGGLNQAISEYALLRRERDASGWRRAGATFTKAIDADGTSTVSVAHGPTDQDLRIVAVTTDGTEVAPSTQDAQKAGGVSQTTVTFRGLDLKRVKSFRLQVRRTGQSGSAPTPKAPMSPAPGAKGADKAEPAAMSVAEALEALAPGGELDIDHIRAKEDEAIRANTALNEANERIKQAKEERDQAEREANGQRFTVEDFARVDPEMAAQMRARGEDQARYDALVAKTGVPADGKIKSPAVINAAAVLRARIERMQAYADELNKKFVIHWKPDGSGGAPISKDLSAQENNARRLEDLYKRQTAELHKLHQRRAQALMLVEQFRSQSSAAPINPSEPTTRP